MASQFGDDPVVRPFFIRCLHCSATETFPYSRRRLTMDYFVNPNPLSCHVYSSGNCVWQYYDRSEGEVARYTSLGDWIEDSRFRGRLEHRRHCYYCEEYKCKCNHRVRNKQLDKIHWLTKVLLDISYRW